MKTAEDYVPFGIEWKAELKKTPKDFLIEQLRTALMKNQELEEEIEKLKKQGEFLKKAGMNLVEEKNQERNKSKELWIAATQIVHLHLCEQEGIGSGQPTPKQWLDAVDKLSKALHP